MCFLYSMVHRLQCAVRPSRSCSCFLGGATSSPLNYRPCHPSHLVLPSLCLFNLIPPISLSLLPPLSSQPPPSPQGIANHIPSSLSLSLPLSADEYRGSPTFRRRKQKLVRKGPIWPEWDWIGFAAGGCTGWTYSSRIDHRPSGEITASTLWDPRSDSSKPAADGADGGNP